MKIKIYGDWHEMEMHADQDRQFLKFLFGLEHSHGKESSRFYDDSGKREVWEYRANCSIDTDDYIIEKATSPEVA